jgi:hypothetical protein
MHRRVALRLLSLSQGEPVTPLLRRSTVAVAATAVALSAGGASIALASPHPSAAARTVTGGKTSVQLNGDTINALIKDNFAVAPTGRAKVSSTFVLTFPVTGGKYGPHRSSIRHAGGIKISRKAKHITVKNLTISSQTLKGTAVVTGHGRMSAVKLGPPQSGGPNSFGGYSVSLSKPLIKVLDKKFNTKAFKKNPTLGTGQTTLKFKK